jgi:hypothetical protein
MNISVRPSFSSRSESFWINVEIVAICFSFGNDLLGGGLFVSLASVCSWSTPRPLAGGEDAVLLEADQYMLQWLPMFFLTTIYSQLKAGLTTNMSGYKTTL